MNYYNEIKNNIIYDEIYSKTDEYFKERYIVEIYYKLFI